MRPVVTEDQGSALLEFIVVGVAIIMPLVYVAIAVMTLHAGSFAAHAAAREAGGHSWRVVLLLKETHEQSRSCSKPLSTTG